jgi:cell division FtsZ-interacting protein ZapD
MSTRTSDAIRPSRADLPSLKQQRALLAYRRHRRLSDVMEALMIKKPAASRLLKRGQRNLRALAAIHAVDGDPLDALAEVRNILAI